jgi:hypothetical protein
MAARKQLERPFVATGDPGHERLVAVIHLSEVVSIANARPFPSSACPNNGRGR